MNGGKNLAQPQAPLHRQHKLSQQFAGVLAHDRGAEDAVAAGLGEHLHEALLSALHDGAVEFVQREAGHVHGDALLLGVGFGEPDAGHLRLGEGGAGNHAVVGLEGAQVAEQGIHRRIPGLVGGGMGELERPGHIAGGVDVRVVRLQVGVGGDRGASGDAQVFEAIAREPGTPAQGAEHGIAGDPLLPIAALHQHHRCPPGAGLPLEAEHLGAHQQGHAIGRQGLLHLGGHIRVFLVQQALAALDLGDRQAQLGQGLGQFAGDRAAPQHHQPRAFQVRAAQPAPHRLTGEQGHRVSAGPVGPHRLSAGGQHDRAGRELLLGAGAGADRHGPGIKQAGVAAQHLHPQALVAHDAVVGGDGLHLGGHPREHLAHTQARLHRFEAIAIGAAHARCQPR